MELHSFIVKAVLLSMNSDSFESHPRLMHDFYPVQDPVCILKGNEVNEVAFQPILDKIVKQWYSHQPERVAFLGGMFADGAVAGHLIEAVDQRVSVFEQRTRQKIRSQYETLLSDLYHVAFDHLYNFGQKSWSYLSPKLGPILETGKLVNLVRSEYFYHGQSYCDAQHQKVASEIDLLREFIIATIDDLTVLEAHQSTLGKLEIKTERFFFWQMCLKELQRFNHLYHYVYTFHKLYHDQWQKAVDVESEIAAYRAFSHYCDYDLLLQELKAALHNTINSWIPKSQVREFLGKAVTGLRDCINYLSQQTEYGMNIREPRELPVVMAAAKEKVLVDYQMLKPLMHENIELPVMVEAYLEAIDSDNFVQAAYVVKNAVPIVAPDKFDWGAQDAKLAHYKQQVDALLLREEQLDSLLYTLYELQAYFFPKILSKDVAPKCYTDSCLLQKKIREHLQKVAEVRINLGASFSKAAKIEFEEKNKDLQEWLLTRGKNMLFRYLTKNYPLDGNKKYDVMSSEFIGILKAFNPLAKEISDFYNELTVLPALDLTKFEDAFTLTPETQDTLVVFQYPLFTSVKDFYQYLLSQPSITEETLKIIRHNCAHNRAYSDTWRREFNLMKDYLALQKEAQRLSEIIPGLRRKLAKLSTIDLQSRALNQILMKHCEQLVNLPMSATNEYEKHLRSLFNESECLSLKRVAESGMRKIFRFIEDGGIFDQTQSIVQTMPNYLNFIQEVEGKVKEAQGNIEWHLKKAGELKIEREVSDDESMPSFSPLLGMAESPRENYRRKSLNIGELATVEEEETGPSSPVRIVAPSKYGTSRPRPIPQRGGDRKPMVAHSAPSDFRLTIIEEYDGTVHNSRAQSLSEVKGVLPIIQGKRKDLEEKDKK